eukprot:COSAG05_NODE_17893_length_317_cov_1.178899_1_plen_58_part_00
MWRHAMQMGKDAAVEELLDDVETSRGLYGRATYAPPRAALAHTWHWTPLRRWFTAVS